MSLIVPRPPFDPELEAVLAVLGDRIPPTMTAEMIPGMRQAAPAEVTDEMLEASGLSRRDVAIPGYLGDEITVSVVARRDHRGLGPGIYHTHGGGMVSGDRFSGLTQALPWVVEHDACWSPSTTGSLPNTPTRTRSRTATPGCSGRPSTHGNWAWTPTDCSSPGRAPGAVSPRASH